MTTAQGACEATLRHFPSTGHNIQGPFLAFFDRHGGEEILGLPCTKMEYDPLNPLPYQVQLSLLGDLVGYRSPPIPDSSIPSVNHSQRRYYPQTGHTLSYAFLEYFDSHGGLDVFGFPITELLTENGTAVQYFQRAKMEWHPENPIPSQVTLANLGDEYMARIGLPPSYVDRVAPAAHPPADVTPVPYVEDKPRPSSGVPPTPAAIPTEFSVLASVKYPITGQGGTQTVYARATDVSGQGVAGAIVEIVVRFRNPSQVLRTGHTDAAGGCFLTFNIGHPSPGYTVIIQVRVTYGGLTETVQTSFIPWW